MNFSLDIVDLLLLFVSFNVVIGISVVVLLTRIYNSLENLRVSNEELVIRDSFDRWQVGPGE